MRCCPHAAHAARAAALRDAGEAVASGSMHVDNIAPSLYGGLVLTVGIDHPRVKQIPVPPAIRAVIVHPHMFLSTREARAILKSKSCRWPISSGRRPIWPDSSPAATPTIWTCCANPSRTWSSSRQRAALIPGFAEVRRCGAVGRGDRLLDFRRGTHGIRLVPGGPGGRGERGHGAAVPASRPRGRPLDHAVAPNGRARHRLMQFATTRQPQSRVGFSAGPRTRPGGRWRAVRAGRVARVRGGRPRGAGQYRGAGALGRGGAATLCRGRSTARRHSPTSARRRSIFRRR